MADVFISYASEDRDRIIPIVNALEEEGWSAFWDWKSIPIGRTWREVIDEGLEVSRCILVVWSIFSTTKKKRWVLEEADYGLEHAKLIPALIDDVRPPRGFGQIQAAKLIDWTGDSNHAEFKKLVQALESIIGPSPKRVRESERASRAQVEREPEPFWASLESSGVAGSAKPLEAFGTSKPTPPRKKTVGRIGIFAAIAVALIAGSMLIFRSQQQPTRRTRMIGETASHTAAAAPPVDQVQPAAAETVAKPPTKKFTNSLGMEFLLIPAGSFTMGSRMSPRQIVERLGGKEEWFQFEQPARDVTIAQSFYLQTTEVTQKHWKEVMGENPSYFNQCGNDCPVESVSWEDVQIFIAKLNQLEQTNSYRLPSEAEWEYAGRAGSSTDYSFGDDSGKLGDYAWFLGNSDKATQRVATKKPNPRGLYDMHGNVAEWVEDDWHASHGGGPADGRPWVGHPRSSDRVVRGGGWGSEAQRLRSAGRSGFWPECRDDGIGLRLASSVTLDP